MSRRLVIASCAASAILLASCAREPDLLVEAPVETTAAENRPEPEDPAVAERRRLAHELASLEKRQATLALSFEEQENEVEQLERELRDSKRALERQKAETNDYIDQHEVQVACAYAASVARGEGEYSEKTRKCAEVAKWYCAVGMLSSSFRRKVAAARRYVDEAEARAQSLKVQIADQKKELETQRAKLEKIRQEVDRTAFEIATVHQKLGVFGDGIQLPRGPGGSDPWMPW